jgi:outer membrane protein TolC
MIDTPVGDARRRPRAALFAALLLASGCSAGPGLGARHRALAADLAALEETPAAPLAPAAAAAESDPFSGASSLEREPLVAEVLRRNQSLRAARFAWSAALARFPQVTALEDPMLGYGVAPRALDDGAHRVDLRQAFPFPGKLRLRGEIALAEAEAAAHDFAAARLRLATMASLLFDDYYLAARALEVNHHHREILAELRAVAAARYEAGEVSAQAPLQAEFELVELERAALALETAQALVTAQLNGLLHRDAVLPLPPPPLVLEVADPGALDLAREIEAALAARPELRAAEARVRAGEAAVGAARREFLPDFAVTAAYDGLWEVSELRPFVGLELNVPLQLGRRRAALDEARAELERARSERGGLEDEVRVAVVTSARQVGEAARALTLYRDRLLPAARDQLGAARAAFETGLESFLAVLGAEEDLRDVELGEQAALAELDRRRAELRSATGALPLP